ncbi:hypothetical protein [Roseovarius albus]|nr:hypothetical protein [Roseovarius albus]
MSWLQVGSRFVAVRHEADLASTAAIKANRDIRNLAQTVAYVRDV